MKIAPEKTKALVRVVFGALLVYYVLDSRMIDFGSLKGVIWNPYNLALSFAFYGFSVLLASARWFYLMRAQGLSTRYRDSIALNMIGNFCNTFIPGSVGGDLVKAWFSAGFGKNRRTRALVAVFLDRILGLCVMVFYAAVVLVLFRKSIARSSEFSLVGLSLWAFTACAFVGFCAFFSPRVWRHVQCSRAFAWVTRFKPAAKALEAILLYQSDIAVIVRGLLLSALSLTAICVLWSLQGASIGLKLDPRLYFLAVPLVLTASAVPILPRGFGVGQVMLFTLLQWLGIDNPENGGSLCTLMQVHMVLFSCLGAVVYAKYRVPSPIPENAEATPVLASTPMSEGVV